MSFLTCKGLVMRFAGVTAIDGVDFSMDEGTVHCLIGPNGAGKSTFFKMVTGQLTPSAGQVHFRDKAIAALPSNAIVRHGIGIKMQTPQSRRTDRRGEHLARRAAEARQRAVRRQGVWSDLPVSSRGLPALDRRVPGPWHTPEGGYRERDRGRARSYPAR